ncbi:hypothetical protein FJU30_16315 [Affinibrenneria salicis]|uniref:C-type lysozyme inhibitor domain-containing protein n=1 Tax=Affinibrenneria salicis TaxID=2590031 RepID=A0A5J5FY70_9GAMM|nr:hypothetical protein [Affinibrenneria salicis]KAA8998564.1 hypothetical protein FJU30_16315 [Affinibrenneria salicis]
MQSFGKCLAIALSLGLSSQLMASEPQWLEGTFVNQDKTSLAKELAFCPAGKASFSGIRAAYVIEGKDNERIITLYSNGAFKLKVAQNGDELLPADDFTKQWLTETSLKRDPNQQYQCNQ